MEEWKQGGKWGGGQMHLGGVGVPYGGVEHKLLGGGLGHLCGGRARIKGGGVGGGMKGGPNAFRGGGGPL